MDLDRVYGRIFQFTLILTVAGAAIYFAIGGWRQSAGFLLGGGIAFLNFYWLKRTVFALGETAGGKPPRARTAVVLGLRYLLLGAAAYAIFRVSEISVTAFLVGLFAPTAAVILVILIELFYART
jgi:hypothetical protein